MKGNATTLGDANRTPEGSEIIRVLALDSSDGILALYRDAVQGCKTESGSGLCFELHWTRDRDDALKAVESAVRERKPFAVIFLEHTCEPEGERIRPMAETMRRLDPHVNFVLTVPEGHGEDDLRPDLVSPADKLLVLHKPLHRGEIRQFVSTLGMKWLSERLLSRANRELERKVSQLRDSREALLVHQKELQEVNQRLMETNNALSVLARNLEKARRESEERMLRRFTRLVVPIIDRLQGDPRLRHRRGDLDLLRLYIQDVTRATTAEARVTAALSPAELRVALLIQKGLTTDEVAGHLNLSTLTVKTHRRNIRRKLKLQNRSVNLQTYLQSEVPGLG